MQYHTDYLVVIEIRDRYGLGTHHEYYDETSYDDAIRRIELVRRYERSSIVSTRIIERAPR